jgi:tetratricopeptide (TPR) repeat protein
VTAAATPSGGGGTAARRAARASGSSTGTGAAPARAGRSPGATRGGELDPDALAALEEQRDFLLRSLRDLDAEHDAGDLDDDDHAALKDDYTARAAAVLRAIESRQAAFAARPRQGRGRAAVSVAVVVVAAVLAGVVLAQATGRRTATDSVSGDIRQNSRDLLLAAQQATGQATQALQAGDSQAAVEYYREAIGAYDEVLQIDPANAEAMTYRGWLLHNLAVNGPPELQAQLDAEATTWLDRAVQADPAYPDARVFKAILLRDEGRLADAKAQLDAVPDDQIPPFMQPMVQSLRDRLG